MESHLDVRREDKIGPRAAVIRRSDSEENKDLDSEKEEV